MMKHRLLALPAFALLAVASLAARAEDPKIPLTSDDKATVYVEPSVSSTETTMESDGATVGVQKTDGASAHAGMTTDGKQPEYKVGASTGGDVALTVDVKTDTKKKQSVEAGVKITY